MEHGGEFGESNPYMKFKKNLLINDLECPKVQTNRQWPFWQPSSLLLIGQIHNGFNKQKFSV